MALPKYKATGQRGSWFAEIGGEPFPCVHDDLTKVGKGSMVYLDPHCQPDDPARWIPFIAALKEKKQAILTRDTVAADGNSYERQGYIALFRIDHVVAEEGSLRFNFIERVANLV
jgi:hypothetical protein